MSGINYCNGAKSAVVTYWFNDGRRRRVKVENLTNGLNVSITPETVPIFERNAPSGSKAPTCGGTLQVFLVGIAFTAPNYPNCPYAYGELLIGEYDADTKFTIETEPVADGCKDGLWVTIPEVGFDSRNNGGQWKEPQGLKFKCVKKGNKITLSSGFIDANDTNKEGAIRYNVACDDECPEGQIKCPKPTYPGYCCINSKDYAQIINRIGARL